MSNLYDTGAEDLLIPFFNDAHRERLIREIWSKPLSRSIRKKRADQSADVAKNDTDPAKAGLGDPIKTIKPDNSNFERCKELWAAKRNIAFSHKQRENILSDSARKNWGRVIYGVSNPNKVPGYLGEDGWYSILACFEKKTPGDPDGKVMITFAVKLLHGYDTQAESLAQYSFRLALSSFGISGERENSQGDLEAELKDLGFKRMDGCLKNESMNLLLREPSPENNVRFVLKPVHAVVTLSELHMQHIPMAVSIFNRCFSGYSIEPDIVAELIQVSTKSDTLLSTTFQK